MVSDEVVRLRVENANLVEYAHTLNEAMEKLKAENETLRKGWDEFARVGLLQEKVIDAMRLERNRLAMHAEAMFRAVGFRCCGANPFVNYRDEFPDAR